MTTLLTMEKELYRLSSFVNWPEDADVRPSKLAKYGFYYTGSNDTVTCFLCQARVDCWRNEETLLEKHKRVSPNCEVANGNWNVSSIRSKATPRVEETAPLNEDDGNGKCMPTTSDHSASNVDFKKVGGNSHLLEILEASSARLNKCREQTPTGSAIYDAFDRKQPASSDFDNLRIEDVRLRTFHDWPTGAYARPEPLARDGFFYTGGNDRVQCAFCRGFLRNWEPNDDPNAEHRKHFPDCPFLRGQEVGNKPLSETTGFVADLTKNQSEGNVCENSRETVPTANLRLREDIPYAARSAVCLESNSSSGGVPLKHPEYADYHRRIQSFSRGKVAPGQTVEGLSDAGWFYSGPGDKVLCFQCGGSLKEWRPNDDPWEEHKKWYPRCQYWQTNRPRQDLQRQTIPAIIGRLAVDPREVKARMDTASVRAILEMGFSRDVVKRVIENRLATTGDDFVNAEALMEAIFLLEETMASALSRSSSSSAAALASAQSFNNSDTSSSSIAAAAVNWPTASSASASSRPTAGQYSPEWSPMSSLSTSSLASTQAAPLTSLPVGLCGAVAISSTAATSTTQSLSPELFASAATSAMVTNAEGATEASTTKGSGKKRKNKKKKKDAAAAGAATSSSAAENLEEVLESCLAEAPDPSPLDGQEEEFSEIHDDESVKYEEENRQLREARTCKVCMDAEVNTVFLPCGHLVCCNECSPQLRNCPICRTFIRGTVKTFLS